MNVRITENASLGRFEAMVDDELAGFLDFERHPGFVALPHIEVSQAHRGQGVADLLVRYAFADVEKRGELAYPLCPYTKQWVSRHPDFDHLVYQG